jgi:hypothetical protein
LWDRVGARYFETIGTPILRGRGIAERDTAESERVAVVNETFVRRFFPTQDPIGAHFGRDEAGHAGDYTIVGVAKDARYRDPTAPIRPMFFVSLPQTVSFAGDISGKIEESSRYIGAIELYVRGDPDQMQARVREAMAAVDPNLPPVRMTSFDELIAVTASERTLIARLSDAFGAIALLLAAVGLYGVTSYRVSRRTEEIGLRMALGATPARIAALVVGGACSQIGLGVLLGIPLAFAAARALEHQLFGVSPFNAAAFGLAAAVVFACAMAASALPARRATSIAPIQALRSE